MPILLALLLVFAAFTPAAALEGSQPAAASAVKGDVLYWEGEELIVKEISGREVRMHVNADTKIENAPGRLKTGDKVEAMVTTEGHALSIKLQIPDSGPATVPPGLR
jgi:hypothetical protein